MPSAPVVLRAMYEAMAAAYGPQYWWPSESAIETVVGAYLTQNTSWRNVERSIAKLKAAGVMTVDGLRAVDDEELRELIRPSGYMVRKGAALKAFVALLDREYGGRLEQLAAAPIGASREALLALPGVGPETADAILLYALRQPVMVVDEYLRRVIMRHGLRFAGLDERARYGDLQQLALAAFASDSPEGSPEDVPGTLLAHYNEFHALIVMVGKTHCGGTARCEGCPLNRPEFTPPPQPELAPRTTSARKQAP